MIKWPSGCGRWTWKLAELWRHRVALCGCQDHGSGAVLQQGRWQWSSRVRLQGLGDRLRTGVLRFSIWPRPRLPHPSCPDQGEGFLGDAVGLSHAEPAACLISGGLFWTPGESFYEFPMFMLSGTEVFTCFSLLGFLIPSLSCLFLRSMWLGAT